MSFGPNPWQQGNWDARAAGNFIGGGAGCGLIVFTALSGVQGTALALLMLAGVALVGIGLFCVLLELGRPMRALRVFANPRSSWMSREALASLALFPCALAAAAGVPMAPAVAALAALVFAYCQARILLGAKGIVAWREPLLLPLLLASALAEGGALFWLAQAWSVPESVTAWNALWLLFAVMVLARALLWRAWRARLAGRVAARALIAIDGAGRWLLLVGSVLPLVLALLATGAMAGGTGAALLAGGAALAVFGTGAWFKLTLITRAGFNQGFALVHLPVRGVRL